MRIYVGNLSFKTTEAELKEAFGRFGEVSGATIVKDRNTDRSRGFGFVEMEQEDEAKAAIEALNGASFQSRNLKVNEARPLSERPPARSKQRNR